MVDLAGVVTLAYPDSTDSTRVRYLLDVDADNVADYRLNFGPADYVPPSEATRPNAGDEVTISGALMSHGEPPMVHVHTINGLLWFEPRDHGDGAHGGDGGGRGDGFGCGSDLTYVDMSGVVMSVMVFESVFLAVDYNNDGNAEYVIDFGDNVDPMNSVVPQVGETVDIVGGMLGCTAEGMDQEWVVVYEVNGEFYRMPGDTDGLDPILGSAVSENPNAVPVSHLVATNYPNPFNPTTTIDFSTPITGLVTMTVFDVLGRQVATLINDNLAAGSYTTSWNAAGLPSGMYMYRLTVNEQSIVNRMLLLK
ncbi:MAG: T9SS type A sorting domain-containing protein [bacterium]|nr:T9SS type A sorting domain-containing protein [bacterium]